MCMKRMENWSVHCTSKLTSISLCLKKKKLLKIMFLCRSKIAYECIACMHETSTLFFFFKFKLTLLSCLLYLVHMLPCVFEIIYVCVREAFKIFYSSYTSDFYCACQV